MNHIRRSVRRSLASLVSIVAVLGLATAAEAIGVKPANDPAHGDTRLCISTAYACTGAGYGKTTAMASGWPWSYYGGKWASYNSYGPHNCTLYAAYRLQHNGLADPGWHDNAGKWYTHLSAAKVNSRPAIGAIAEWTVTTPGHVAYVESVSASGITITDDNYRYNYTTKHTITWNSTHWPSKFLHIKDVGPTWPGDVRNNIVGWRNADGSITSWLVDAAGRRHWIATTAIYWCLRNRGAKDLGPQPDAILKLLPLSSWATCN